MGKSAQEDTQKLAVRHFVHSYIYMNGLWGFELQFEIFPKWKYKLPIPV